MPSFTGRIRSALAPAWALCLLLTTAPAEAHFQNFLARILHLQAAEGGTLMYARLPLASVLLPADWNPEDPARGVPFVQPRRPRDAADALLLDTHALAGAPEVLRTRLSDALQLVHDHATDSAASPPPQISAIRIQPIRERSPFSHLPQIQAALTAPLDISPRPLALADAVVDFRAFYADVPLDRLIEIRSNPREWPGIAERSINILTLHRDGERTRLSSAGALQQRLVGATPPARDLGDSIRSGYRHVLIGLDHVLFMLILILAARHWRGFLRNSLAFTLGHSITLAIGAAGLLSATPWFIPLIETAIALSILYSGACLLLGAQQRLLAGRVFFIGLLHGLGFAFVLQQASGQAPGDLLLLWLGFNLGIEAGQLSIYLAAAPLLWLLARHWPLPRLSFRTLLAAPCLIAAAVWTLERSLDLASALGITAA
jgi:hydrogenase/urease accessory protein HupE